MAARLNEKETKEGKLCNQQFEGLMVVAKLKEEILCGKKKYFAARS